MRTRNALVIISQIEYKIVNHRFVYMYTHFGSALTSTLLQRNRNEHCFMRNGF